MEISTRQLESCVILDVEDDFLSYPKTVVFKNHIGKILDSGQSNLVLNLEKVKMVDSFGIASMISILKLCRERRGNLTMYGLNEQIMRLIEMTHMDRVLDIWPSESQAVRQAGFPAKK